MSDTSTYATKQKVAADIGDTDVLVGESGGLSAVYTNHGTSGLVLGTLMIETEHGYLHVDPDEMFDVVDQCPCFVARFNPQAWVRGNAVDVDPEGEQEWDATAGVARMPADHRQALVRELDKGEAGAIGGSVIDRDDWLSDDPNAPEWVRNWSGPFDIWVRRGVL